MNKKKSKVLAFLLATAMLVPSANGIVSAADLNVNREVSKVSEEVESVKNTQEDKLKLDNQVRKATGNEASANGVEYPTLKEALEDGGEVKLLRDVEVNEIINITKDTTLDLGDFTITDNAAKRPFVVEAENFTIKANKGGMVIPESNTGSFGFVEAYVKNFKILGGNYSGNTDNGRLFRINTTDDMKTGTLEVDRIIVHTNNRIIGTNGESFSTYNATIKNSEFYDGTIALYFDILDTTEASTVTIENTKAIMKQGAIVEMAGGNAVLSNNDWTVTGDYDSGHTWSRAAIGIGYGGVVTVKSGTYSAKTEHMNDDEGYGAYIYNSGGTLKIEGGSFKGTTASIRAHVHTDYNIPATIDVHGGEFEGDIITTNLSNEVEAKINIEGGNFKELTDKTTDETNKIKVTGGSFDKSVKGFVNGKSLELENKNNNGGKNTFTYGNDIDKAILNANSGSRITLLSNITADININKDVSIEIPKDKTLTLEGDNALNVSGNLTISGEGNVVNNGGNIDISNNGTVNIENNFVNNGNISNKGNLANLGNITNNGNIKNNGRLTNSGTLTNEKELINESTMINRGNIEGNSAITNNAPIISFPNSNITSGVTEAGKVENVKSENQNIELENTNTNSNSITVAINNLDSNDKKMGIQCRIVEVENSISRRSITTTSVVGNWVTVNTDRVRFTGLKPNTKYNIYIRYLGANQDLKSIEVSTASSSTGGGGGNYIPSKPTYTHEKIIGSDRYETAGKIADKLGSYDNVVLVNAESSMSDGLSASGLAGKENGAILLTKKDSIPKATMDRIKKVKKVYIIGGEAAISQKVYDEITKNVPNIKVERLGGKDRVETSEIVAKKLGNYSDAFVVNGFKGEADAMSVSAIAAKKGAPILLTNGKTSTHAKKSGVEYYVIGGNSVVDKSIADKYNAEVLAGKDRYATNKEVINEFYSGSDKVYIANGDKLVDALTASPLAKKDGIVLVNEKSDKSILKGKNTVQVGGMDFEIEFEK